MSRESDVALIRLPTISIWRGTDLALCLHCRESSLLHNNYVVLVNDNYVILAGGPKYNTISLLRSEPALLRYGLAVERVNTFIRQCYACFTTTLRRVNTLAFQLC